jgi:hypothetical protein
MAWWEWLIVLGMWASVQYDLEQLRRGLRDSVLALDARWQEARHALEYDITELKRGQRRF